MKQKNIIYTALSLSLCGLSLTATTNESIDFGTEIYPILRENCLNCHSAPYEDVRGRIKEPKGGLRLDSPEWISKGAIKDDGSVTTALIPGDADASELYSLTILPVDHDDLMPPRGEPLTPAQTELLKNWINQGADFGNFEAPEFLHPKSKQAIQ
jgi:hypothetical protein